jgi:hypothetical protein
MRKFEYSLIDSFKQIIMFDPYTGDNHTRRSVMMTEEGKQRAPLHSTDIFIRTYLRQS